MNYIVSKHTYKIYNYHPDNIDELKDLIDKLIEERGNKANLNDIDTSAITNMRRLFIGSEFNGDISNWDVSNVTNMRLMFAYSNFNGDISNWDVNNVKDMDYMFEGCTSTLQTNPPSWFKINKI